MKGNHGRCRIKPGGQTISDAIILNDSVPADWLVKVVNCKSHEIFIKRLNHCHRQHQRSFFEVPVKTQRHSAGRLVAEPMTFERGVDMRFQGVPPEELLKGGEEGRIQFFLQELCMQFCLIQTKVNKLQNSRKTGTINILHSARCRKEMIHSFEYVEGFEVRKLCERTQCPHCMRCSLKGVVYCDCGTFPIPSEQE